MRQCILFLRTPHPTSLSLGHLLLKEKAWRVLCKFKQLDKLKFDLSGRKLSTYNSLLQHIEINRQKLQQASDDNENMEHRMHPPYFDPNAIEHRTDGVGDAAA